MTDWTRAITDDAQGAVITIHVTAGAKKTVCPAGYHEWRNAIVCSVTAPAVGGKANRAVLDAIAEEFAIPVSRLSIVGGATSPQKRIRCAGCSRQELIVKISPRFMNTRDDTTP
jgi:uncharacterized protein (TIGR00251 family)